MQRNRKLFQNCHRFDFHKRANLNQISGLEVTSVANSKSFLEHAQNPQVNGHTEEKLVTNASSLLQKEACLLTEDPKEPLSFPAQNRTRRNIMVL